MKAFNVVKMLSYFAVRNNVLAFVQMEGLGEVETQPWSSFVEVDEGSYQLKQ